MRTIRPTAIEDGARILYLDGFRGLAVLLVVAHHYLSIPFIPANHPDSWYLPWHHLIGAGWVGVDLFFVLSGFLLGGILLDNRAAGNLFPVFYLRRACRILPVYGLLLAPLVIIPLTGLGRQFPALVRFISTGDIPNWAYPLFLQNIVMAAKGSWGEAWLAPTWSLAVEEQFYIVLPLLVRFVPLRLLPVVLLALAALSPLIRVGFLLLTDGWQASISAYALLPCRWDSLFLGAVAAWLIRNELAANWLRRHGTMLRAMLYFTGALGFGLAIYSPALQSMPMGTVGYSVFAVLGATAVLAGHFGVLPLRRLLEWSWLCGVGRVSYVLYLVHLPICSAVFQAVVKRPRALNSSLDLLLFAVSFVASLALAAVSWQCLEKPILRFARRTDYWPAGAKPP